MNYECARPTIESGTVLAWTHRSFKSWYDIKIQLVRMFTRSEYAHVGVAWVVGGRVFAIEAVMPLVRIYPLSKLGSFYRLSNPIKWTPEVEEFALKQVGQEYSQWQAIKAFFGIASDSDGLAQCAELVRGVLRVSDSAPVEVDATPTAIVQYLLERGATLQYIEG